MSAANKKYQQLGKKVHGWKARNHLKDKELQDKPESSKPTTKEVVCSKCGFKAYYPFLRCPDCDEVQK